MSAHDPTPASAQACPQASASAQASAVTSMRRVAFASGVGTTIEFYDFLIYGTAAALVFGKVFLPALGPAAATVASFATLGVAFVARPVGPVIFGHFGDRLGRKRTLVVTLLMMGTATALIGAMPTSAEIGVAAPICVVALRFVQGLAVGGEWAGATLLSVEHAPKGKREFYAASPQLGPAIAFSLASATFLALDASMSDEAFLDYGWRIPFLASLVLVAVGLWVRLRIEETPVFAASVTQTGRSRVPFGAAFREQPRQVLLGSGVMAMVFTLFYLSVSYLTSYATSVLRIERHLVLGAGIVGGIVFAVAIALGGALSDRLGRRRLIAVANAAGVVWSLALFPVLDLGTTAAFVAGLFVSLLIAGIAYGPVGAYLPELIHTQHRYTAAGLCYNLSGIVGGAVPPLVAVAITSTFGSFAFGASLAALCLIGFLCILALGETRDNDLTGESDASTTVSGQAS